MPQDNGGEDGKDCGGWPAGRGDADLDARKEHGTVSDVIVYPVP